MRSTLEWAPWSSDLFAGMDLLRRDLGRAGGGPIARGEGFPPINFYETDNAYILTAELPGVARDDLDLSIEGNRVTVRGERKVEYDTAANAHRRERQAGSFERRFELPAVIDPETSEAVYRDGILTLRLAKAAAAVARSIDIRVD